MTFRPELYDRFPDSATYLTYGSNAFDDLLQRVPEPDAIDAAPVVIRTEVEQGGEQLVAYHRLAGGVARPITSLDALAEAFDGPPQEADEGADGLRRELEAGLRRQLADRLDGETRQTREYLEGRLAALRRDARHSLEVLLSIDFARSHRALSDDLEDEDDLNVGPLLERRLANREIPFPALVAVAQVEPRNSRVQVRTVRQFVGRRPESLNATWGRQLPSANRIVSDYKAMQERVRLLR